MRARRGVYMAFLLSAGLGTAGLSAGCNGPVGMSPDMASVWVEGVTLREAFNATEATLREQDFRMAERDPDRGYLRSYPTEGVIAGGTGRLSDAIIKPQNAVRRVAEAYVSARQGGVAVRYRVTVERLDTAKVRAWTREHEVSDTPVETPIDQEQGTLPVQNETWTSVRRDASMEADIRLALLERLGRQQTGATAP